MIGKRPPHLCNCGMQIIPHGEHCPCQIKATHERNARHDRTRLPARKRGYDHNWRKARREYLTAHPYCMMPGCNAAATTVDHIIAHRGDRSLFWNSRNWQALCTRCHNSVKQRLERKPRP